MGLGLNEDHGFKTALILKISPSLSMRNLGVRSSLLGGRQGDSLPPFLFILVVNILSMVVSVGVEKGWEKSKFTYLIFSLLMMSSYSGWCRKVPL